MQSFAFIKNLEVIGKIYGFVPKVEYHPMEKSGISSDIVFKTRKDAYPIIIFEVESRKNPNMVNNADKILRSRTQDVKKPWFFFHIVYSGTAGQFRINLSQLEDYSMYMLFEDLVKLQNKKNFVIKLNDCIKNISADLGSEDFWMRYEKLENDLSDLELKNTLKEQIVLFLDLPPETINLVNLDKLSIHQARQLNIVKSIMNLSPKPFVDKIIELLAREIVKNNWTIEEMQDRLETLKFNYIRNRSRMFDLNIEHDKNIASSGFCYCLNLRREEYKKQGKTEEEIKRILANDKWGKENHVHAICEDPNDENYGLYFQIMYVYGINHSDLKSLEPTEEEIIWLLKQDNKWKTTDKKLCWNCGIKPYVAELNGFWYCIDCATVILKENAKCTKNVS